MAKVGSWIAGNRCRKHNYWSNRELCPQCHGRRNRRRQEQKTLGK